MSSPATEIDPRYSDRNAVATQWSETLHAIEAAELFWISTVRADGRPHVTPLVAVWLDDALHFCTGADEQKSVNLRQNPHVVLTTGCNSWEEGLDVVVEGDAVPVTDDRTLRRLAQAWTAKWDGRWQFQAGDGCFRHPGDGGDAGEHTAQVYAVRPAKVLAFAKGDFGHTRHRF
jgi:nitroimidazol reductase NimA-like FMN-containing flavoprotein (pyridoxamine 5'-phosphate oxidase superfamily)